MARTDVILRWGLRPATQLAMSVQPSNAPQNGIVFPQQPSVQLKSSVGGDVSQAGIAVTVALASGGLTLSGTLTVFTDAAGVASFTDLVITGLVGDRTLQFSSGVLIPAISGTISLVAGPATTIQDVSATTGDLTVSTGTTISVQVVDQSGNPVSGVTVTFTVVAGGGARSPSTAVTDASGIASTLWTIGPTAGASGSNNNELDAAA